MTTEDNIQVQYNRVRLEDRKHWYLYDSNRIHCGTIEIVDAYAPIQDGTHVPPFNLEGTEKYNIWTGRDWVVIDAHPNMIKEYSEFSLKIDEIVDSIYKSQIGSRQAEYDIANTQAKAWAENNFEGSIPSLIQATVNATGKDAVSVAKEIIAIASVWGQVVVQIREKRLLAKASIKALGQEVTRATYNEALNIYTKFKSDMDNMLQQLG